MSSVPVLLFENEMFVRVQGLMTTAEWQGTNDCPLMEKQETTKVRAKKVKNNSNP